MKLHLASITMFFIISTNVSAICQPQCVPYARESSGIDTNKVGATGGAVDWYNLAKSKNSTTDKPGKNRVMALNPTHTWVDNQYGHVLNVRSVHEVIPNSKYTLLVSHSNGDGNCSVEEDIKVTFYQRTMLVKFEEGFFKGQKINVLGFIRR